MNGDWECQLGNPTSEDLQVFRDKSKEIVQTVIDNALRSVQVAQSKDDKNRNYEEKQIVNDRRQKFEPSSNNLSKNLKLNEEPIANKVLDRVKQINQANTDKSRYDNEDLVDDQIKVPNENTVNKLTKDKQKKIEQPKNNGLVDEKYEIKKKGSDRNAEIQADSENGSIRNIPVQYGPKYSEKNNRLKTDASNKNRDSFVNNKKDADYSRNQVADERLIEKFKPEEIIQYQDEYEEPDPIRNMTDSNKVQKSRNDLRQPSNLKENMMPDRIKAEDLGNYITDKTNPDNTQKPKESREYSYR